jgi:hypothetical protein
LIIQDPNTNDVTYNAKGGDIIFEFDIPVLISDIGLLDVEETGQMLKFAYKGNNGHKDDYTYVGYGINSAQRVIANKRNVKKLIIRLRGSGAVTELNFCQSCF